MVFGLTACAGRCAAVEAELPRAPSGKVRRAEIAALLQPRLKPQFTPPRGEREALVARLFTEVLGVDAVGALDNFFELGGDSLRGAQLVSRVNEEARAGLDVASLFRYPTVAEFAAELGRSPGAVDAVPPPIRPASHGVYRPDASDAS